jgi:nitrite reductase/ring-hydroxylating ferredoxin subunit
MKALYSDVSGGHVISRTGSQGEVKLCHIDELREGRAVGFDPSGDGRPSVFVVKKDSALFAYRDLCPHYGTTQLPWKKDEYLDKSGEVIVCAAHGARFEVKSGKCISGPCLGQSLTAVMLHVSNDGYVTAELYS